MALPGKKQFPLFTAIFRMRPFSFARESGASMVEFAFTIPLFFFLLAGAVDFTRVAYSVLTLRYAVTSAARWSITGQTSSTQPQTTSRLSDDNENSTCDSGCVRAASVEDRIKNTITRFGLDSNSLTISICPSGQTCTAQNNAGYANQFVAMRADYPVSLFFQTLLNRSTPITVSSSVFVKNEPF